jgi:hypothetical protein
MERESKAIVCRVGAGAAVLGGLAFGLSALLSAGEPKAAQKRDGGERAPPYGQAAASMLRDNPELAAKLRIELTQDGVVQLPPQTMTYQSLSDPTRTPKRTDENSGGGTFDVHWSEESHEHKARITVRRAGE